MGGSSGNFGLRYSGGGGSSDVGGYRKLPGNPVTAADGGGSGGSGRGLPGNPALGLGDLDEGDDVVDEACAVVTRLDEEDDVVGDALGLGGSRGEVDDGGRRPKEVGGKGTIWP